MFERFAIIWTILKSKAGLFIQIILLRWYVMIMIPAVIVTYYVFKGLQSSGFFTIIENFISTKLDMLMYYAKICPTKILNLYDIINCFGTEPPSEPPPTP